MTHAQGGVLHRWIDLLPACADEWHHGGCVGADREFSEIVVRIGGEYHCHPPTDQSLLDWQAVKDADVVHDPLPYLDRNKAIVDACDVLLATPHEMTEQQRSGTWSTIRYARKQGKRIVIFYPDGSVVEEPAK